MAVYLIHFLDGGYKHAKHYLGYSHDVEQRLLAHRNGTGARLMEVVTQAGISWILARVWPEGTYEDERRLKRWHGSTRLCPICAQERLVERLGLRPTQEETWL